MFPIELFDSASISRIGHIQLSCVSFRPPFPFRGFPNLRKLDLDLFDASEMDLDEMLSGCSNLEWLSFNRCDVNDELKKISRLLYTMEGGYLLTLVKLSNLKQQNFAYMVSGITFEYVLTEVPDFLRGVQNFTFQTSYLPLEKPLLLENIGSFPQLRFLGLTLLVRYRDSDNILSLASFLRAAPLIEELEMHFDVHFHGVGWGTFRSLPPCPYNYLRKVQFTGFNGIKGQLEFLLHIVENAPALKVLTIDQRRGWVFVTVSFQIS